jgi:hypothetical protein
MPSKSIVAPINTIQFYDFDVRERPGDCPNDCLNSSMCISGNESRLKGGELKLMESNQIDTRGIAMQKYMKRRKENGTSCKESKYPFK